MFKPYKVAKITQFNTPTFYLIQSDVFLLLSDINISLQKKNIETFTEFVMVLLADGNCKGFNEDYNGECWYQLVISRLLKWWLVKTNKS